MAAPGSLEARYQRLAGPVSRRHELYVARTKLHYSIDDWLALPWWQRRVYLEGMSDEADAALNRGQEQHQGPAWVDALYDGTLADVAATTAFQTG